MTILDVETTKFQLKQMEGKHNEILHQLADMDIRHRSLEDELLILEGRITQLREIVQHNPLAETFEQTRARLGETK